jgi:hypothetical protein
MFQVEWLQSALDELAAIWMQADSALRQAITVATHQIDQLLQHRQLLSALSTRGEFLASLRQHPARPPPADCLG